MKKLLMVFLLLIFAVVPAFAQTEWVKKGSALYEKPDSGSAVLLEVSAGASAETLSEKDGWTQVRIGGTSATVTGYLRSKVLTSSSCSPVSGTAVSPYGTPMIVLRSCASDSYQAIGSLSQGESVQYLGKKGSYLLIKTGTGLTGWLGTDEVK